MKRSRIFHQTRCCAAWLIRRVKSIGTAARRTPISSCTIFSAAGPTGTCRVSDYHRAISSAARVIGKTNACAALHTLYTHAAYSYHEVEQHRIPVGSEIPPAAAHSTSRSSATERLTGHMQGGLPHSSPAATIPSEQHDSAPPSRSKHPSPPQDKHDALQHTKPKGSGMPPIAAHMSPCPCELRAWAICLLSIRHGGSPHITSAASRLSVQHAAAPPSRSPHPVPPHVPQAAEQHLRPVASVIPPASSQAFASAVASWPAPSAQGGLPHELEADAMLSAQHESAPPSRDAQSSPPQVPHVRGQQTVPRGSTMPPLLEQVLLLEAILVFGLS